MIWSSKSNLIPVFLITISLTYSIKSSISNEVAVPSLTKKLKCLSEIYAPPTFILLQSDSFINYHTFFVVCSSGFLNVLPQVFIWEG